MIYFAALAIAIGFGLAIAAIGSAFSIGKAAIAALEGTARQPEAANDLRVTLIIVAAILLMGKLPPAESIIGVLK